MSSVEQRARELLAAEYQREGIKGVEPEIFDADRAALRAIAAALREQPEVSYKLAAEYVAMLLQRAARRIMSKSPRVADDLLGYRTILLLGLTAEQQPEARGVVDETVKFNAAFFVSRTGTRIEQLTTYEDYRRDSALLALMDLGQKRASSQGLTRKNAGKVTLAWVTAPQIIECDTGDCHG